LELALPEIVMDIWSRYQHEIEVLGFASLVTLVLSALLIPYLIVQLPADFYAVRNHQRRIFEDTPVLRFIFLAVKNTLGVLLLVVGVLMLVLPGQGILTVVAALTLLDFPGKRKLELRILHMPALLKGINGLRRRAGRKPLLF
jgi:amino acid transporter